MLVSSLKAGLYSLGVNVLDAGMIPTPAIAYLVKYYDMDAVIDSALKVAKQELG